MNFLITLEKHNVKIVYFVYSLSFLVLLKFLLLDIFVIDFCICKYNDYFKFEILTTILPTVISLITLAISISNDKLLGVERKDFNLIKNSRLSNVESIDFWIISIVLLILGLCSYYFELELFILIVDFFALFYSIWFIIQEIPILNKNNSRLISIIRKYYIYHYDEVKDIKNEDEKNKIFNDIVLNLLLKKGFVYAYTNLKREKKKEDIDLYIYLINKQNNFFKDIYLNLSTFNTSKDIADYYHIDLIKTLIISLDNVDYILDDNILTVFINEKKNFDISDSIKSIIFYIGEIVKRCGLFELWKEKTHDIFYKFFSDETSFKNYRIYKKDKKTKEIKEEIHVNKNDVIKLKNNIFLSLIFETLINDNPFYLKTYRDCEEHFRFFNDDKNSKMLLILAYISFMKLCEINCSETIKMLNENFIGYSEKDKSITELLKEELETNGDDFAKSLRYVINLYEVKDLSYFKEMLKKAKKVEWYKNIVFAEPYLFVFYLEIYSIIYSSSSTKIDLKDQINNVSDYVKREQYYKKIFGVMLGIYEKNNVFNYEHKGFLKLLGLKDNYDISKFINDYNKYLINLMEEGNETIKKEDTN